MNLLLFRLAKPSLLPFSQCHQVGDTYRIDREINHPRLYNNEINPYI